MPPDVTISISLCLVVCSVFLLDRVGRRNDHFRAHEVVTIGKRRNIKMAIPRLGICKFDFGGIARRSVAVCVNGKSCQELRLSGYTRLSIIVQ